MDRQRRRYGRREIIRRGLLATGVLGMGLPAFLDPHSVVAAAAYPEARLAETGAEPLVDATLDFGFRLFGRLVARDPARNVVISPTSIAMALDMTYNGARGETQQGMATALGLPDVSLQAVNAGYEAVRTAWQHLDPHVRLTLANALWPRKGLTLNPGFVQRARAFYGAALVPVDFHDPHTPATINRWVSQETHGKITSIVDRMLDPATVLYLTNAVYFKGRWTVRFDKARTRKQPFTLQGGTRKMLPMMSQSGRYRYYQDTDVQAISLPYGTGRLSLYVFLPAATSSLAALQARLNAATWRRWMAAFRPMPGTIVLPRFTVDYGTTLNRPLADLGMQVAFDRQRADFSGMVTDIRPVYIGSVAHKTVMAVDEDGTTAAAATSVGIQPTLAMPTFSMVVDRPFFFAIRDNTAGAVLFMGRMVDPA